MKFSVLMSIYQKEKSEHLDVCLESISNQTLLPNEIVLVEDGPLTKELNHIIQKWKEKIKIIKSIKLEHNSGFAIALNAGLKACSHNIIARMDTDDFCVHERFEKQISYFKEHSEIDILGSHIAEYDETFEKMLHYHYFPLTHKKIYKYGKLRNPFHHATVVFKKSVILELNGYPHKLRKMQDYALWGKLLASGFITANYDDILVKVRAGDQLYKRRRGLEYIRYEIQTLKYMKDVGYLNFFEYLFNLSFKTIVRILPISFIKIIYEKLLRQKKVLVQRTK